MKSESDLDQFFIKKLAERLQDAHPIWGLTREDWQWVAEAVYESASWEIGGKA